MKRITLLLFSACIAVFVMMGCAAGQPAASSSQSASMSASSEAKMSNGSSTASGSGATGETNASSESNSSSESSAAGGSKSPSESSAASEAKASGEVKPTGEAKATGEPWIDSNVLGVVTKDTQANVRQDYYVAGAKDWLATVKLPEGNTTWSSYDERRRQVNDLLIGLVEDKSISDHDVICMRNYYQLLSDWNTRNAAGIGPVMDDVREVQAISSIDELSAYLVSDGVRLRGNYIADDEGYSQGETLLTLALVIPTAGTTDYRVGVGGNSQFTVAANGYDVDETQMDALNSSFAMKAQYMLERAGYSKAEAETAISLVANLESRLSKATQPTEAEQQAAQEYLNEATNGSNDLTDEEWEAIYMAMPAYYDHTMPMTRNEMAARAGDFPILQLIDAYGFGNAVGYDVSEPKWLSAMGEVYNQQNLEALKAHVICGILLDNMRYLDEEASSVDAYGDYIALYAQAQVEAGTNTTGEASADSSEGSAGEEIASMGAEEKSEVPADRVERVSEERQTEQLVMETLKQDMPGVVTNAFVAHCYPESTNVRATDLTYQVIAEYRELINGEDWLDSETKTAAIAKLDALEVHVGYPSSLNDTAALEVPAPGSGASLYDASKALDAYNVILTQRLLEDPSQGMYWQNPMDVNAYYSTSDNAIFVGCGIIGGMLFDEKGSIEQQYATFVPVVGHEISHAFDSSGAYYDKDGNYVNWWTIGDLADFEKRTAKVKDYMSTIKPLGDEPYNGEVVCSETIADMGGLKVALMMAEDIEAFDYKEFFDTYLLGWQRVGTMESLQEQFYTDSHPLEATRANVSVMQEQAFYDTYGIQPGDTMYLAPENRIAVW